jgi:hypothetical protein
MKCDYCKKKAVANYQKIWVRWEIKNDDYAKEPDWEAGMNIEEPTGENNVQVCAEHEKKFFIGK